MNVAALQFFASFGGMGVRDDGTIVLFERLVG